MFDEKMLKGNIPWSTEGLYEAIEHFHWLCDTPHDDWNRREQGLFLADEAKAEVSYLRFNPDQIENQMANWIMNRYEDDPEIVCKSHLWRWMQVRRFMSEHTDRLMEADLLIVTSDEKEGMVSEGLIEVLATSPYEAPDPDDDSGRYWDFDVDMVVDRALKRHQELEDEEEG